MVIDDALPFEAGALEIEDQSDGMAGDFQVVEHLADFVIGNAFDDFCIHYYKVKDDEIRDVFANLHRFIDRLPKVISD
jgi:hypothetical protein